MPYKPCQFDRTEYKRHADLYEAVKMDDFELELCEFNDDPEDLAAELSYTRYALAKAEHELREVRNKAANWKDLMGIANAERDALAAWSCSECGARFPKEVPPVTLDGVDRCSSCARAEKAEAESARLREALEEARCDLFEISCESVSKQGRMAISAEEKVVKALGLKP